MKTKSALFLMISALFLAACSYTNPASTTTSPVVSPTPTVTISPTSASNVNDLNAELNATVDDGGQADLKELQKEASGL